jgi:hypothetical protein
MSHAAAEENMPQLDWMKFVQRVTAMAGIKSGMKAMKDSKHVQME